MPVDINNSKAVIPVNINDSGFEFLEKMQGHWIGENQVMGMQWPWFAFDYRAVSESHVFGIFEGGTMGNLLTSFFVTDFKGTRTIMVRNGGLLNGIYRTSYMVLDKVENQPNRDYYRFVDAVGGAHVMFLECTFSGDSLLMEAFTSRMGENAPSTNHMSFNGKRQNSALAQTAAQTFGFPQNQVEFDFSGGLNTSWMYTPPSLNAPQSATFMSMDSTLNLEGLAAAAGDPVTITDHTSMARLDVSLIRPANVQGKNILVFLSYAPLTDSNGNFDWTAFDSVILFPEVHSSQSQFEFTYLHSGPCYVTAIADMDGDGSPGVGDITSVSTLVNLAQGQSAQLSISDIDHQN
ncbi:MAG: hypothetical protein SchgKO_21540 [Schleiferiaceae bacterium]